MEDEDTARTGDRSTARRRLLRALGAGGACTLSGGLPSNWRRPLLDAVLLPAHAQVSAGVRTPSELGPACGPSGLADRIPDVFRGADFTPACLAHDLCYSPAGSGSRIECDLRFLRDLLDACRRTGAADESCVRAAYTYYATVRRLGAPYFYAGRAGRR